MLPWDQLRSALAMKLEGRTILITGGIYFEFAKHFIVRRNTVLITGHYQRKLEEAQSALPSVHTLQGGASKPEEIQSLR